VLHTPLDSDEEGPFTPAEPAAAV